MIDEEQLTGPSETLFLLLPEGMLILPWEGGEAMVPREDLVAFLCYWRDGGFPTLGVEVLSRPLKPPKAIEDP